MPRWFASRNGLRGSTKRSVPIKDGEAACPTTVSGTGHPAMRFAPPRSAILLRPATLTASYGICSTYLAWAMDERANLSCLRAERSDKVMFSGGIIRARPEQPLRAIDIYPLPGPLVRPCTQTGTQAGSAEGEERAASLPGRCAGFLPFPDRHRIQAASKRFARLTASPTRARGWPCPHFDINHYRFLNLLKKVQEQ